MPSSTVLPLSALAASTSPTPVSRSAAPQAGADDARAFERLLQARRDSAPPTSRAAAPPANPAAARNAPPAPAASAPPATPRPVDAPPPSVAKAPATPPSRERAGSTARAEAERSGEQRPAGDPSEPSSAQGAEDMASTSRFRASRPDDQILDPQALQQWLPPAALASTMTAEGTDASAPTEALLTGQEADARLRAGRLPAEALEGGDAGIATLTAPASASSDGALATTSDAEALHDDRPQGLNPASARAALQRREATSLDDAAASRSSAGLRSVPAGEPAAMGEASVSLNPTGLAGAFAQALDAARSGSHASEASQSAMAGLAGVVGAGGGWAAHHAATSLPELPSLRAPLSHADFGHELAQRVLVCVQDGIEQARLQLNPAEMGPVAIRIALDGSAAQVAFQADRAETRAALERSLPELAAALHQAGLTLSGGGVFSQDRQAPQDAPDEEANATGRSARAPRSSEAIGMAATAAPRPSARPHALLDTYV